MGLFDINLVAEDILIPIFKEVYGYENLVNLNLERGTYPGIDLGDKTAGVAIQVTSNPKSTKITETLQKFAKHNETMQYKHLIVYIITEKQGSYSVKGWPEIAAAGGYSFSKDEDIRDFSDLMHEIRHLETDQVRRIEAIYRKQFGTISKDEAPELFAGVTDLPRYGLIGRDPLLLDLITRLSSGDQVALSTSGKGGAGKTALAVSAAHHRQLLAHFSDGVLWASVGPERDPALELGRWAEALNIKPQDYPEPLALKQAVSSRIGQRSLLLVLDDIWQPDHADLLRFDGPNCAHQLTTRQNHIARRFAGGQENALDVPDLEQDPAFALLAKIAPEACAVDETAARDLVRQVGGLPLAVELLGGYLAGDDAPDPELFPDLSQDRLNDLGDPALRLRQAQARIGDATNNKVKLSDIMALSLDGFDEEQQAAFYALGAFAPKPATFGRAAAEAVSGASGALLSQFANRNLLEIESGAFSLHQVLADLAGAKMDEEAQARHAAFYLALANEGRSDWRRIDKAYEQIRWAWERVDEDGCLDWVWALRQHQVIRGLWREIINWHERGLAWSRGNNVRKAEATMLSNLGWAHQATGRPGRLTPLSKQETSSWPKYCGPFRSCWIAAVKQASPPPSIN